MKQIILGLPQLAFYGLSENWLMKEMGDMHWKMLCESFGCNSDALTDSSGNRLYSSFVRVRHQGNNALQKFNENDKVDFQTQIKRFGNKMFFSDIELTSGQNKIDASLMTVFVARKTDNKSLTKSVPTGEENCTAKISASMPEFAKNYFDLKTTILDADKKIISQLNLGNDTFELKDNELFSTDYEINPYTDLNGLNLLYFASYPLINDICERRYFNKLKEKLDIRGDWALEISTVARDVLYFGNCDIEDMLSYRLDSVEFINNYKVKLISSLSRKKDNTLIAKIFTVKQLASV